MSWARLEDRFHGNPKVLKAWRQSRASVGLHVMAITHCAQHETDGLVAVEFVEGLLPAVKEREHAVLVLLNAGLWEPADDGCYRVHDYLDYNPSRGRREALRVVRSEAGRRGGLASGDVRRTNGGPDSTMKRRARNVANTALKAGRIQHGPCADCGAPGEEMHHIDYSRPEEVTWLCRPCHTTQHETKAKQAIKATGKQG